MSRDWSILAILSSDWLTGAATLLLISVSAWTRGRHLAAHAKWMGFVAVIFFCLAAVIFPIGFSQNEIGGAAYQLPNSYQVLQTFPSSKHITLIQRTFQVGISYIFFVMALWTTVISELFASKICLPHF